MQVWFIFIFQAIICFIHQIPLNFMYNGLVELNTLIKILKDRKNNKAIKVYYT